MGLEITRREFVRRGFGVAALAGLGVGGLASCGGQEEARRGSGSSGNPVEIEYWHINTETFGGPAVKELVRRFNEQNKDVKVRDRFHDGYTALLENLQTSVASDAPPDVSQVGYNYLNYVAGNFPIVPVEELAGEYGEDGLFESFPENILELGRVDGGQAGMPYGLSVLVVYYNADILSRADLDPRAALQDWAGWEEAARVVKEETGKAAINFQQFPGDNFIIQAMIESNGGRMLGCEGGQAAATFDSPEGVEAVGFWADLVERDLALNVQTEQSEQAFLSGNAATLIVSIASRASLEDQADFDLRGAPFPSFGVKERRLPSGGNNLFVFSQDEAKREAAWRFLRFLESPEALTTWVEQTGYLSPREGVAEDFTRENPIQAVAAEQLPVVVPWISFPGREGLEASQIMYDATQGILGGQVGTEEGLGGAAEEVDGLIEGEPCPS